MAPPYTSPNVDNYFIGKGNIFFKDVGADDSTYRHVGNVPKFEFTPKLEKLEHYSSMAGTKVLDKVAFVAKGADVSISLEEITPENLIIGLLAEANTSGSYDLLKLGQVERTVKLVGSNDFGARIQLILFRVFFNADKTLGLIDEKWGSFDLNGSVLRVGDVSTGSFGTLEFLDFTV